MAGSYPSINDNAAQLLQKIAWNWYLIALDAGVTGLNPPSVNDNPVDSLKKIDYYMATTLP